MSSITKIHRVVAAAIIGHDGKVCSLPPPARHHDVIRHMVHVLDHPIPIKGEQGFVLSDGTFARRRRAKVMAVANDQILPHMKHMQNPYLFSEDLW